MCNSIIIFYLQFQNIHCFHFVEKSDRVNMYVCIRLKHSVLGKFNTQMKTRFLFQFSKFFISWRCYWPNNKCNRWTSVSLRIFLLKEIRNLNSMYEIERNHFREHPGTIFTCTKHFPNSRLIREFTSWDTS